ncbi:MAG: hypothetical protein L0Y38_10500 [Methylococcaceae bacterium]|nr:hypothetical protein [Methylococcaceae bacterium]MCI0734235.1 hypothetical protein [Methylococcaceae bacterium]
MKLKELQTIITEKIKNLKAQIEPLKALFGQLRKEHSESKNTIAFVKQAFTREILEKKERIPGAIISAWILLLLIVSYDWTFGMDWPMVFYFGVLPFIVYYIVRTVRQAPSS